MTVDQTPAESTSAQRGGSSPPRVAVVITHYRSVSDLNRCLRSIAEHGGDRVAEVVVCDSAALPRHSDAVHDALPRARYLGFQRNVGYAALVNAGVTLSHAEYVLVLNADVELGAGAVDQLAAHLDAHDRVAVAAPRLDGLDGELQHSTFRFYRPMTVLYRRTPLGRTGRGRRELSRFLADDELLGSLRSGAPIEVDWALGAALLLRRAAFDDVGPLDERYFLYFEDVDECLRCWRAGWSVHFLPTARVRHAHARASAGGGLLGVVTNPLLRTHITSAARFFRHNGLHPQRPADPASGPGEPDVIDLRHR